MKFYFDTDNAARGFFVRLDRDILKVAGFEAGDRLEINVEEGGNHIIITKAKKKFDAHEWARNLIKKYSDKYDWGEVNERLCIAYEKVTPTNRMGKFGYAQCHPNDVYDVYVGGAIAICRAEGIPLPNELTSGNIYKK